MINALLGQKIEMDTRFDSRGAKIPVTLIKVGPCPVVQVKTKKTDGYSAVQIGLGTKKTKRTSQPILGHAKKGGLSAAPRFLGEVRLEREPESKVGEVLKVDQVFSPGDKVAVTGVSKGRGFAGVMKRWGFKGGPATHGQSDRQRAPGSIGAQGVARVLPGKKMPGRMGAKKTTVTGLTVVDLDSESGSLWVKGAIPGPRKGLVMVEKTGEVKNFTPLFKKEEGKKEDKKKKEDEKEKDQEGKEDEQVKDRDEEGKEEKGRGEKDGQDEN